MLTGPAVWTAMLAWSCFWEWQLGEGCPKLPAVSCLVLLVQLV